ncbi:MAG: SH3 domain-containing protein [Calditrichaceae bacterium]
MYRFITFLILLYLMIACSPQPVRKELPADDSAAAGSAKTGYVLKETVNLRARGNTRSDVVNTLNDGDEVSIHRNVNGWYEISTENHIHGWIRSDLIGPRSLSHTRMAAAFTDSTLPAFNSELYFDKTELYRTIYLILPEKYYGSESSAKAQARNIGDAYQEIVYQGDIEIRVMKPDSQDLFTKVRIPAIGDAEIPVPVLDYGWLVSFKTPKKYQVVLNIAVPENIKDSELLRMARKISGIYSYPYTKAEIYIVNDNANGIRYLNNTNEKTLVPEDCRLYYLEDQDGELYKFGYCGEEGSKK